MTREDFRRELGDAVDSISGSPSPDLPDRVRSALVEAPERHDQVWIAALAAAVIAVILVGVLLIGNPLNRGPLTPGGLVHNTPSASTGPSAAASPSPTVSPDAAFMCTASSAIMTNPPQTAFIDDVRYGSHTGYDRVTIEFQNGQPSNIEIRPQTNTTFTRSPRGDNVKLLGKNGILVIIRGADAHTSYNKSRDFKTGYKTGLMELYQLEDNEGQVSWGLGFSTTPCYRTSVLPSPTRLVIDIMTS